MLNVAGIVLVLCLMRGMSPCVTVLPRPYDLNSELDTIVHGYQVTARNFPEALIRVANDFRIPMGLAWVNTPAARAEVSLSWGDTRVRDILEDISRTQPGYSVAVINGVVHVLSVDVPAQQNFLFLRVGSFEVHHEKVEMAERKLRDLARSTVAPRKRGGGVAGSLITNIGDPRIDVQIDNANVEAVLDSLITGSSPKRIWLVTFVDSSTPTATGFRRTLTLWNNTPVPDDEQPLWNTFSWGDPVPWSGVERR